MGNWFGTATPPPAYPPPPPQRKTEDTIQILSVKIQLLERQIKKEGDAAVSWKQKGDRARALVHMKNLKRLQTQLQLMQGQLANLEQTSMAVASAQTNVVVAQSMQEGAREMREALAEAGDINIDEIATELGQAIEDADELGQALARPFGVGAVIDEDDLDAELGLMVDAKERKDNTLLADLDNLPPIIRPEIREREKKKVN